MCHSNKLIIKYSAQLLCRITASGSSSLIDQDPAHEQLCFVSICVFSKYHMLPCDVTAHSNVVLFWKACSNECFGMVPRNSHSNASGILVQKGIAIYERIAVPYVLNHKEQQHWQSQIQAILEAKDHLLHTWRHWGIHIDCKKCHKPV